MKTLITMCLLLLNYFPAHSGELNDLYISITMTVSEHSRDSNSTRRTIKIDRNRIIYDESHSGYAPRRIEPIHKQHVLTTEEIARLESIIREHNLLTSNSLKYPFGEGSNISYDLTVEIKTRGKSSSIRISGPINSDEMKANHIYKDADSLWTYIKSLVDKG